MESTTTAAAPYIQAIQFLGTSAAVPMPPLRNVSSLALLLSTGPVILVDCGEATQHQISLSSLVNRSRISVILLTHLHGDHCFGIFGLLCSLSMSARTEPLTLVGPAGVRNMVETVLQASHSFLTYPVHYHEIEETGRTEDSVALSLDLLGVKIDAVPLQHTVPCFGYVITTPSRTGALDHARAVSLGALAADMKLLKSGQDVHLPDGRVVRSAECVGPEKPGAKVAIFQDCSSASRAAEAAARGCDLLIHECTYDASMTEKAAQNGHSTSSLAGRFAASVGARNLVMTHLSSRYCESRKQVKGKEKGKQSGEKEGGDKKKPDSEILVL